MIRKMMFRFTFFDEEAHQRGEKEKIVREVEHLVDVDCNRSLQNILQEAHERARLEGEQRCKRGLRHKLTLVSVTCSEPPK